jgi:hypothetical protein
MSKTVKRLLWQHTLKATVLRHPLPPAPMLAPESKPERAPAKRSDFTAFVNGRPVDVRTEWGPVPYGPEFHRSLKVTIPTGTLKVGKPVDFSRYADLFLLALPQMAQQINEGPKP